jgi:hypothetical protein
MTSNFTAAELRDLADELEKVFGFSKVIRFANALREYADLKEAAEKGVTPELVITACNAYDSSGEVGDDEVAVYPAMHATLTVVAPLLALKGDKP